MQETNEDSEGKQSTKPSAEDLRNGNRYKLVGSKLTALASMNDPDEDLAKFITDSLDSCSLITHSAKLHCARTLSHSDGVYADMSHDDGYVHSLSVKAKEAIAGDVNFDVAGNAKFGKVYVVAAEIARSQKIREFASDPKEIELLDDIDFLMSKKIEKIKSKGLNDAIPGMLPTTAHLNDGETRVFTIMQSALMTMRYSNAKAMHENDSELKFLVRKAEVRFGSISDKTQNTTALRDGTRSFAIVHATSKFPKNSQADTKLYALTKNGLVAKLGSIHMGLQSDIEKLLGGFHSKHKPLDEKAAAVQRHIEKNLVKGVATRLIEPIAKLVKDATEFSLSKAFSAYRNVGFKMTEEESGLLQFLHGESVPSKQLEACSARLASKLLATCKRQSGERSFNANQHQYTLLAGAIFGAILEARK
jgi:hypothetical protein